MASGGLGFDVAKSFQDSIWMHLMSVPGTLLLPFLRLFLVRVFGSKPHGCNRPFGANRQNEFPVYRVR